MEIRSFLSKQQRIAAFSLIAGCLGTACASSGATSVSAVGRSSAAPLRRFIAVAMTPDPITREHIENAIAEQLEARTDGVAATPSYRVVDAVAGRPAGRVDLPDENRLLATSDFDAVVVCRPTDAQRADVYVPGEPHPVHEYYGTIWDYYGFWKPLVFSNDYVEPAGQTRVETDVYRLPSGELVYASVSARLHLGRPAELMLGIGLAVSKDLQRRGLIRTN